MSQKQVGCEYIVHEDGIHEFIFHVASHQAVDTFMEQVSSIFDSASVNETVCVIIDLSESGLPSLRYAMAKTKQRTNQYFKDRAEDPKHLTYIALVSNNSIIQTFKFFMEQLARGNTRMKICADRKTAMVWLQEQSEGVHLA